MTESPRRRRFLQTLAGGGLLALAGCSSDDDPGTESDNPDNESTDDPDDPGPIENTPTQPVVEDPPNAVYKPTHTNSVGMVEPVQAGDFQLLPHFTYPHRFWLVRGTELEEVEPIGNGLHLMLAFWDAQTGESIPVDAGATMTLRRDGEIVEPRFQPWPMLSQQMGFHFGDNVPFTENGTYEVEVQMGPIDARKTGAFAGRFEEAVSTTFELEFTRETQATAALDVNYLDESEWGEPGAVEPMGHGGMDGMDGIMADRPSVGLPPAEEYPGRDLGVAESDDAQFVVRYVEESRLSPDGEGYLLVSPRTPYNRAPLPDMALTVEGAAEGDLRQTLDDELGHHYGLAATLESGDSLDIVVETPPQAARHQGYETALLAMAPMTVEVE